MCFWWLTPGNGIRPVKLRTKTLDESIKDNRLNKVYLGKWLVKRRVDQTPGGSSGMKNLATAMSEVFLQGDLCRLRSLRHPW